MDLIVACDNVNSIAFTLDVAVWIIQTVTGRRLD
jgi:hypothetical protein